MGDITPPWSKSLHQFTSIMPWTCTNYLKFTNPYTITHLMKHFKSIIYANMLYMCFVVKSTVDSITNLL